MTDVELVTVARAAELTSLSTDYLYLAMARGELACHRFGRARRIAMEDLDAFVRRARVPVKDPERHSPTSTVAPSGRGPSTTRGKASGGKASGGKASGVERPVPWAIPPTVER